MKKVFLGIILAACASCEYNNIGPRVCFVTSTVTTNIVSYFTYNSANELVSYKASDVTSSILASDAMGNIISELDNGDVQINYTYDEHNRLILWTESFTDPQQYYREVKFMYNSSGQNVLKQYFLYHASSSSYILWRYMTLTYSSTSGRNYSERKLYDANSALLYTENFLWDNHPNPYLSNAFFINEPPPSNNVIQYTLTFAGGSPQVTDYTYTYNSNGFPLTQTIPGYATIASYTYTNCN
jgi:YD repeat-containing protein